jgi:zinc D-Ala-D-Ala carboxypeptidase
MRLTSNFYLSEFTSSATALRLGLDNTPNKSQIKNIIYLCENVLQPCRDIIGAVRITSGYRSPELCKAIGSKKTSQHTKGEAVDIQYHRDGIMNNKLLMDTIIKNCEFDQLIEEFTYSWIHVSYSHKNNRNQILKAYKDEGKTKYLDITRNYISL